MAPPPTVRIFFSSPGDVKMERETARRIVERMQAELGTRAVLEPYFWEHEIVLATKDYQQNIPAMSDFDVVVCVLWSRLGSPLHPERHRRPGGGFFESGTEYEFFTAMEAHRQKGTPDVLVFRNRTEPRRPSRPKEAREAVDREVDRLDQFFDRYFREGGFFTAAINSYRTLGEFEDKLTLALRGYLEQRLPAAIGARARSAPSYAGRPYLGLAAFEFDDAPVFFGRTAAVGEVVVAFQTQELESRATGEEGRRFVLVLGASGSGKSSLARAGVLPMLVQPGVIEGAQVWRRAIFKPGDAGGDPFAALAQALLSEAALPELGTDGTQAPALAGLLKRLPAGAGMLVRQALNQASAQARAAEEQRLKEQVRQMEADHREDDAALLRERIQGLAPPTVRLALLADQLEEIFTTEQATEVTAAFVECLAALASSGRVFVLGTLRSDFYARCLQHPHLVELMRGSGSYALPAPGPAELGQMIRQPAAAAGLIFEEDARTGEKLDELLRDAALRDPTALPLLSYTLEQLHERKTEGGILTLAAYRDLGGLEGAIGRRAEAVFGGLPAEAQSAFDGVLRQLVTLGEGGAPVRRRTLHRTLSAGQGAAALVDALVAARLFTADKADGGERSITVAHEALLRHWPRLVKWVDENRDFLRARSRLALRYAEWLEQDRTEHYLIAPGPALGEAETLLARHVGALDAAEIEYVQRSTKRAREHEQRRLRRSRLVAAGAVLLTILALIGGAIAWRERGIAQGERTTALLQKTAAVESEKLARASQSAAEASEKEARASQVRAAYLLGIEQLESGDSRAGLTSLAQALTLDTQHAGARDRLYSYHLYGLPKAISLRSIAAPSGTRQRVSGAERGPLQRCVSLDARGAPEVFDLVTRRVVDGKWSAQTNVIAPLMNRTSSHLLVVWDAKSGGAERDMRCCVWAIEPRTQSREIQIDADFKNLGLSDDGRWLVEGSTNGRVRAWKTADGTLAFTLQQIGSVDGIDFDPRSGTLVTCGDELVFFDLESGVERSRATTAEWMASGVRFATEASVCVVEMTTRPEYTPATQFVFVESATGLPLPGARTVSVSQEIFDFTLNEEGTELAVASFNSSTFIYHRDVEANDRFFEHATYARLVRFSPDTRLLFTATSDGTVRIWDATTGLSSQKKSGRLAFEPISHDGRLEDLSVSWDGRCLLTSTSRHARVWDLSVGRALTLPLSREGTGLVARFDPSGDTLWIASRAAGVQAYDAHTLEKRGAALLAGSDLRAVLIDERCGRASALLSDNSVASLDLEKGLLAGRTAAGPTFVHDWDGSIDGTLLGIVREKDVSLLEMTGTAPTWGKSFTFDSPVSYLRMNNDGTRVALVLQNGTLIVRDIAAETDTVLDQADTRVKDLRFSPDGRWLAGAGVGTGMAVLNTTLVWDLRDRKAPPHRCTHGDFVSDLCFSPDSRWLATGTKDQIAQVWDVATCSPASDPMFHANVVRKVVFNPDNTLLATNCGDGTVRVFDWVVARPVSQQLEVPGNAIELAFTPDGTRLAALAHVSKDDGSMEDAEVRVFEVVPPKTLPLDLIALTEATTAQSVSASELPVACDPSEGWRKFKESVPDSWFFQSPTERSISPAFTTPSRRWVNDGSIDVGKISVSMPAVGEVRAAMSYWLQNNLALRRKTLAKLRPDASVAASSSRALTAFERAWNKLLDCLAGRITRLPVALRFARDSALLWSRRIVQETAKAATTRKAQLAAELAQQESDISEIEVHVAAFVKSAGRACAEEYHTCLSLSLQAEAAGDLARAREHIERARVLAPDDLEVLRQAGDVYQGLKDFEAERAVLDRLRTAEPDVNRHRMRLGFNCWHRGDMQGARREFTAVVDSVTTPPAERANMLVLLGRPKEALDIWKAAVDSEAAAGLPPNLDATALVIVGYELSGNQNDAEVWSRRLLELVPELTDPAQVQTVDFLPEIKAALASAIARTLVKYPKSGERR